MKVITLAVIDYRMRVFRPHIWNLKTSIWKEEGTRLENPERTLNTYSKKAIEPITKSAHMFNDSPPESASLVGGQFSPRRFGQSILKHSIAMYVPVRSIRRDQFLFVSPSSGACSQAIRSRQTK